MIRMILFFALLLNCHSADGHFELLSTDNGELSFLSIDTNPNHVSFIDNHEVSYLRRPFNTDLLIIIDPSVISLTGNNNFENLPGQLTRILAENATAGIWILENQKFATLYPEKTPLNAITHLSVQPSPVHFYPAHDMVKNIVSSHVLIFGHGDCILWAKKLALQFPEKLFFIIPTLPLLKEQTKHEISLLKVKNLHYLNYEWEQSPPLSFEVIRLPIPFFKQGKKGEVKMQQGERTLFQKELAFTRMPHYFLVVCGLFLLICIFIGGSFYLLYSFWKVHCKYLCRHCQTPLRHTDPVCITCQKEVWAFLQITDPAGMTQYHPICGKVMIIHCQPGNPLQISYSAKPFKNDIREGICTLTPWIFPHLGVGIALSGINLRVNGKKLNGTRNLALGDKIHASVFEITVIPSGGNCNLVECH